MNAFILSLQSILLLVFLSSPALAADNPALRACTKESLAAYKALAGDVNPNIKNESATWELGDLSNQPKNPLISVAGDPNIGTLEDGDFINDPSCGLAEAVKICSRAKVDFEYDPNLIFCKDFPRLGIVAFDRPSNLASEFHIYRKAEGGWRLVQASFRGEAVYTLPGDGTLQIDETRNTEHHLLKWNGSDYVLVREWKTITLWNGKEFASIPLNDAGEFAGANPDCSIATAERVRLASASPEWLRDRDYQTVVLVCGSISGMPGTELALELDEVPAGPLIFRKRANGQWRQLDIDGFASEFERIERNGFIVKDVLGGDPGCGKQHLCVRRERYRWNGKKFVAVQTWYAPVQPH